MTLEYTARRLPVYLLLDCSGSMAGEPIAALEMGLKALLGDLRNDPGALDSVWISIITFASIAEQLVPLTELSKVSEPSFSAKGTTALGEALELLASCIMGEIALTRPNSKGDWKPLVFILTDGEPTDDWEQASENFRLRGLATVIACGAGPEVNDETLRRLGEKVVRLKDTKPGTLGAFMKWVSTSVTATNQSLGTQAKPGDRLPKPPDDGTIQLVQ